MTTFEEAEEWDHWPKAKERVRIVPFCGKVFNANYLDSELFAGKKGTILRVRSGGILYLRLDDGGFIAVSICCTKPCKE